MEVYIGLFNLREVKENIGVDLKELGMDAVYIGRDLWSHEDIGNIKDKLEFQINPHSCRLIKLYK